jgi:hypothetical protein
MRTSSPRIPISMIIILLTAILFQGNAVQAWSSDSAQQRAQYAAKLQAFFDKLPDGIKTDVSVEEPDSSRLRIVRAGVFREQFRLLFRPFYSELDILGFRSVVLCAPGPVCQETCVSYGSC